MIKPKYKQLKMIIIFVSYQDDLFLSYDMQLIIVMPHEYRKSKFSKLSQYGPEAQEMLLPFHH